MTIPAMIVLGFIGFEMWMAASLNGKPKNDGKWSFKNCLINNGVLCGLLYWGGFFGS